MTSWRPAQEGDPSWDPRLFNTGDEVVAWVYRFLGYDSKFTPDYTPQQMAHMGVFGDSYWGEPGGQHRLGMLSVEFGYRVFATKTGIHYRNHRGKQAKDINYFCRPASLSRDWWLDRHLIHVADPLGWYEWFWWYDLGRRIPKYDQWQINRWVDYKKRQLSMYHARPAPGTAQALLHWGIRAPENLMF